MAIDDVLQAIKAHVGPVIIKEEVFLGERTVEIEKAQLVEVMIFLKEKVQPCYSVLMDLTAVDYLGPVEQTKIVYWLHNPQTLERLRLVVFVKRAEPLPSVTSVWAGADWYERELFDLFGVSIAGHPDLKRLLMPDDWQGHPLRRDYPLTEEPVQFKHGVRPKVPSEIIHVRRNQRYP